ncbi:hypothetical protein ACPXB3_21885 [Gordonia sp. DT219]|uniref:hypothetical protein n=1 Tax=Gordonia sp. DT219 TaxID=3416658 RepID=UPI003CF213A9
MDLTDTIAPRSDQLNAEDLLTGPRTVTVTKVARGSAEQPVNIDTAEFGPGRPFKPSKTVRRILVAAWGAEASEYVGRKMRLYRDPSVRFGGQDVGGIRVSHLSHIDKPITVALTVTRGKRAPHTVEPLAVYYAPIPESFADKVRTGGLTDEDRQKAIAYLGKLTNADPAEVAELRALMEEATDGEQ